MNAGIRNVTHAIGDLIRSGQPAHLASVPPSRWMCPLPPALSGHLRYDWDSPVGHGNDHLPQPQPGRRPRRAAARDRIATGRASACAWVYLAPVPPGWAPSGSSRAVSQATHRLGSTNGSIRSALTGARIVASAPRIRPR